MRPFILYLLFFIVLLSCEHKSEYQGNLIPRDSFVVIMADMHIADAIYTQYILNESRPPFNQGILYMKVFQKHNTDRESFEKTFDYYARNIPEFDLVYDDVVALLEDKNRSYDKKDSLDIQP
ncbi:MAG: hypothetical protein CVU05_07840 [Bacteroidetes bacterium HGW-Bacteroidetes-21]|jgi:hypothetical protein|nr:MAG: hypothetical protein CVU05_07840 [Bacteroidetes bacterium HGW-Bacteroidetes-21]